MSVFGIRGNQVPDMEQIMEQMVCVLVLQKFLWIKLLIQVQTKYKYKGLKWHKNHIYESDFYWTFNCIEKAIWWLLVSTSVLYRSKETDSNIKQLNYSQHKHFSISNNFDNPLGFKSEKIGGCYTGIFNHQGFVWHQFELLMQLKLGLQNAIHSSHLIQ